MGPCRFRPKRRCKRRSVSISETMLGAAELAVRRGLGIVHAVPDWLQSAQIGEDGFQVIIGEVTEITPRHGIGKQPCFDSPLPNRGDEHRLIEIRDSRRIGREIQTGNCRPPGPFQKRPSGERQPRRLLPFSSTGVWQKSQCPTVTRYSPYFTRSDLSGSGACSSWGRG